MALTFVASATGTAGSNVVDASSLNVQAGDVLVACLSNAPEGYSCTVTDSDGSSNAFNVLTEQNSGNGYINRMAYRLIAEADAAFVARATLSGYPYGAFSIVVLQFRPDAGETVTLDTGPSGAGSTWGAAVATASFSPAGSDEVVVVSVTRSAGTLSALQIGGVAVDASASTTDLAAGYRILTAPASGIAGTATLSTDMSWSACAISIRSEASACNVVYDGNGNTGGAAPTDGSSPYNPGDTVTVLGNSGSLAKTNYTFDGWNTFANGGGTTRQPSSTFTITANTTLYAKWKANAGIYQYARTLLGRNLKTYRRHKLVEISNQSTVGNVKAFISSEYLGKASTVNALTATSIASASSVGSPAITQIHALTANSIVSASSVGNPAATVLVALTANNIVSASNVETPVIHEINALSATAVSSVSTVGAPAITQIHILTCPSLSSVSSVGSPVYHSIHALTANDISSATDVGNPVLAETAGTDNLLANSISSISSVGSPTIAQIHAIIANAVASDSSVGSPSMGVISNLIAESIYSGSSVGNPAITQIQVLIAEGIYSESYVGSPALGGAFEFGSVCIDGTWHDCTECYVCISGTWHTVLSIQECVNEEWHALV